MNTNMNTRHIPNPNRPSALKTFIGVVGVIMGFVFFLQAIGALPFSFDLTNALYLKIFAIYAIISGVALLINVPRHGVIRY